jgi:hypothetical protein
LVIVNIIGVYSPIQSTGNDNIFLRIYNDAIYFVAKLEDLLAFYALLLALLAELKAED